MRFALNTPEMDQSKQSISIQGVIMQNTALKLNAKKNEISLFMSKHS